MSSRIHLTGYLCLALLPATLAAEEVNLVEKGKELFQVWGCAECHATTRDDNSIKTGPSLFNLFQKVPREREALDAAGKKITPKADRDYFIRSVREPATELAITESGPTKGTAYPAIMPLFPAELVPDPELEMIWHYLQHAAEDGKNGPAVVMGQVAPKPLAKSSLENRAEVVVGKRPRVFRAPLLNASGRAIHVGLPNGMNYSFDPRQLSLRGLWSGGFIDLEKEQKGRSQPGSDRGLGAREILNPSPALVPLTAAGVAVDFEFKEPDVNDDEAAIKHLWKGGDFLKELAGIDAEFTGYDLSETGEPAFHFRVGKNALTQRISFTPEGLLVIEISGALKTPQTFQLREGGWSDVRVEGGELSGNRWTLPAGEQASHRLFAKIGSALVARAPVAVEENLAAQPLTVAAATADLPPGYQIETWQAPLDTFGRPQLFEPTALAVAKDGTIVVGTRTAGIWRLKDRTWQLFAEGTYECLGLHIEDDAGDVIVIAQKPELTRIRDNDRDGRADTFQTVCDDFGFHANYHEYTHGPVRDAAGNYYFALNLCHSQNDRASYRAGGNFMGSMGGFRGWACRVTPEGKFEPFASGLRSPAGMGIDPAGRLLFIDNQGEYVGTSKLAYLTKDHFYGHPSGLVSLPGMKPDSPEIAFDKWQPSTHPLAIWLPQSRLANSPGNPAWDLTGGKFGPFSGQIFVGDQTLSTLLRAVPERIGEVDQGTLLPFASKLASGVMRPAFLPDGSLLLGQTGRGWQSKGGNEASLQRIWWDGKTTPAEIHSVTTGKTGFTVLLTRALGADVSEADLLAKLQLESWTYSSSVQYGSRENEKRKDPIAGVKLAADRRSIQLEIPAFEDPATIVGRLHHLRISEANRLFGDAPARELLEAYQTVWSVPE